MIPAAYATKTVELISKKMATIDIRGVARYTAKSGHQPGSIAGGLHPFAGESIAKVFNPLNPVNAQSAMKMVEQLGSLQKVAEMTQILSGIGAAASVINVGVSAVGFAIVCQKLNKVQASLDRLTDAVDQLPEVIREANQRLFEKLQRQGIRDISSRVLGITETANYARSKSLAERSSIAHPALNDLNQLISVLHGAYNEALDSENVILGLEIYKALALARNTRVMIHVILGDVGYLGQNSFSWRSELIAAHSRLFSMLTGESPGLTFSTQDSLQGLLAQGFNPESTDLFAAMEKASWYKHQASNSKPLILMADGRLEKREAHSLSPDDEPLISNNLKEAALMAAVTNVQIGNMEIGNLNAAIAGSESEDDAGRVA